MDLHTHVLYSTTLMQSTRLGFPDPLYPILPRYGRRPNKCPPYQVPVGETNEPTLSNIVVVNMV